MADFSSRFDMPSAGSPENADAAELQRLIAVEQQKAQFQAQVSLLWVTSPEHMKGMKSVGLLNAISCCRASPPSRNCIVIGIPAAHRHRRGRRVILHGTARGQRFSNNHRLQSKPQLYWLMWPTE